MITLEIVISFIDQQSSYEFKKLRGSNNATSYYLHDKYLQNEKPYFRYKFKSKDGSKVHIKRCFLDEFVSFYNECKSFNRTDFKKFCNSTFSDGACAFCIMLRMKEHFDKEK